MTVDTESWPPKAWTEAYKRRLAHEALEADRNPHLTQQLNQWQQQQGEQDD